MTEKETPEEREAWQALEAKHNPPADAVDHPSHYQGNGVECIDAIRAALGSEGFIAHCRGTAIKYLWRTGKKGDAVEDLKKAAVYLNWAIEESEK